MNLDLDTLRSLVVAADLGGLVHAAKRLGRTPSAISLQMKRLQADVGAPLFRKAGRGLALTEAGRLAVDSARRMLALNDELLDTLRGATLRGQVQLGCAQDFADAVLPASLERFARHFPLVQVELRIEGNGALAEAVQRGELDLALVLGHAERPGGRGLGQLDPVWIAAPGFSARKDQPLPLAVLGPQCVFRQRATGLLDAAGRRWRVAAVSPSLAGIWAAVRAGLGVTLRSPLGVPRALVQGQALLGLPRASALPVTLLRRRGGRSEALERMVAVLAEVTGEALRSLPTPRA